MTTQSSTFKLRGTAMSSLWAATIGFFFGVMAISLFGPTKGILSSAMSLTPFEGGLLVSIPSLTGSLLRIPFGAGVDGNGGRKGFIFLLAASFVGLIALSILFSTFDMSVAGSMEGWFPIVLILGCVAGCGIATFSVGVSQTSYWFPKNRQGFASGVYAGVGTCSAGILAFLLPIFLQNFGFKASYYILAGMMLVGLVIYAWIGANPPYFQLLRAGKSKEQAHDDALALDQELFPKGNAAESLKISAKIPQTWMLVFTYFTTFGGFMALTAWFPSFWREYMGLDPMLAGGLTAIFSILAAVLRVPGGQLSDKIGGVKVSMFALVLLAVAGILMNIKMGWVGLFCVTLLISVAFGFNNAATMKLVPVYVSEGVGGANGWVGGLGAFGGFVIPPLMGQFVGMSTEYGYGLGFLIFTALAIMNIIINYFGMVRKG
ncbi:MAG: MFS transporter [Prevotella sp.]|jgi:NNP family nitrate/nitrite transporter-like MFS transporter